MYTKIVTGFARLSDNELGALVQSVIEKMTGNEIFPNPVPDLATMTTALTAFREAQALARDGGKEQTSIKNDNRFQLLKLITELALHVHVLCKNDGSKVLSAGFDIRKETMPVGALGKPVNFTVENSNNPGCMQVSVEKLPGAASYSFEYTSVPVSDTSQWKVRGIKARTHIFAGLTRGQEYAFRVAGIGADPTLNYSDVISRYVQ